MRNTDKNALAALYEEPRRAAAVARKAFIEMLADATGSTELTVISWIKGTRNPSKAAKKLIAKALNRPESELFPPKTEGDAESDDRSKD